MSSTLSTSLTPAEVPAAIDNLISLHLHLWQALTVAIHNAWGTSSPALGEDKRAWLAGALSDLFAENQLRDVEDLEDVLGQVMFDEFEVVVDDDTLEETAAAIWSGRARILKGDGSDIVRLQERWEEKQKKNKKEVVNVEDATEEGNSDEEEWNGFNNENADTDMDDAPALIETKPKTKPEPQVDEDGFTTVVSKKKR